MKEIKDTKRASVHVGFDGKVHKQFLGRFAKERFENEVRVLQFLEDKECGFVPRILEADPEKLYLVTTSCGAIVQKISDERMQRLFSELEKYGVKHGDAFARNITYNTQMGRFCVIDFEFATILETGVGLTIEELEQKAKEE